MVRGEHFDRPRPPKYEVRSRFKLLRRLPCPFDIAEVVLATASM